MITIFPFWTLHLNVAIFQQHLYMEYISLSWYDIPELVFPGRISEVVANRELKNQLFLVVKLVISSKALRLLWPCKPLCNSTDLSIANATIFFPRSWCIAKYKESPDFQQYWHGSNEVHVVWLNHRFCVYCFVVYCSSLCPISNPNPYPTTLR